MPFLLPFVPLITAAAAVGGVATGIASGVQQAHTATQAANARNDALSAQATEKQRLEDLVAGAPEAARQTELDKRRKRVKTLLTSQEDTGMATVGTHTLLGG